MQGTCLHGRGLALLWRWGRRRWRGRVREHLRPEVFRQTRVVVRGWGTGWAVADMTVTMCLSAAGTCSRPVAGRGLRINRQGRAYAALCRACCADPPNPTTHHAGSALQEAAAIAAVAGAKPRGGAATGLLADKEHVQQLWVVEHVQQRGLVQPSLCGHLRQSSRQHRARRRRQRQRRACARARGCAVAAAAAVVGVVRVRVVVVVVVVGAAAAADP